MEAAREHRGGGGGGGVHVIGGALGECAHLNIGHSCRFVYGAPVLFSCTDFPTSVTVPHNGRGTRCLNEPPEQLPVKVLAERAAEQVQRDGVDARVAIQQAEPDDPEHVPVCVVFVPGCGIIVKPHQEYVIGQEAHGEHQHER